MLGALAVGYVDTAVAADAEVALLGVADEAFEHAQARAVGADAGGGGVSGNALIAMCFQVFAYPEAAGRFTANQSDTKGA